MAEATINIKILDLDKVKQLIKDIQEEQKKLWTDEEVIELINKYVSDWCDEALLHTYKLQMGKI